MAETFYSKSKNNRLYNIIRLSNLTLLNLVLELSLFLKESVSLFWSLFFNDMA